MIKTGTLCIIIDAGISPPHEHIGKSCTVTGPLITGNVGLPSEALMYPVDIPGVPMPWVFRSWGARPAELVPIAPPNTLLGEDVTLRNELSYFV